MFLVVVERKVSSEVLMNSIGVMISSICIIGRKFMLSWCLGLVVDSCVLSLNVSSVSSSEVMFIV